MLISSTARRGGDFRWHQTSTRITFMSIFTLVVDYSKARGKVSPVCSCQWLTFEVCWMRNVRIRGQREKKLGKSKYLSFTANNLLFGFNWHFFKIWPSQHVFITYCLTQGSCKMMHFSNLQTMVLPLPHILVSSISHNKHSGVFWKSCGWYRLPALSQDHFNDSLAFSPTTNSVILAEQLKKEPC